MAGCSEGEKRAEADAGDQGEEAPAKKMGCPEGKKRAEAAAGDQGEDAPAKKMDCSASEGEKRDQVEAAAGPPAKRMWRLPKEEIDWILAQANEPVAPEFRDLKRVNPSLVPSPEEEKDEYTMLLYKCARDAYEDEERFAVFQAWVRNEYASKGSVEVDYDYFGERAEATRLSKEAREEVLGGRDLDSDSEDDDDWRHFKRTVRGFV